MEGLLWREVARRAYRRLRAGPSKVRHLRGEENEEGCFG